MKRLIPFLFVLLSVTNLFSQSADSLLDVISGQAAKQLANDVFRKNMEIYTTTGKKPIILIQVENIYNSAGQVTDLSKELCTRIAYDFQNELNGTQFSTNNFTITSPYDFTSTRHQIDSVQNYDYTLTGKYTLSGNKLILNMFRLQHIHSNYQLTFKDFKYSDASLKVLKSLDTSKTSDAFQQFIDLQKENTLINNVTLTKNKNDAISIDIQGIGKVYKPLFDIEYNAKIDVKKPVYIYAFFYDPLDSKYPFIWAIENQNIQFRKGIYEDFWSQPIAFFNSGQAAQYSYIKIIASSQKIDIDKYYTRKFIEGYESVILEQDNCQTLLNDLQQLPNIQTVNLVLTFD